MTTTKAQAANDGAPCKACRNLTPRPGTVRGCDRHGCPRCDALSDAARAPVACADHAPDPTADDCPRCAQLSALLGAPAECRAHQVAADPAPPPASAVVRLADVLPRTPASDPIDVHELHRALEQLEPYGRLAAAGGLRALPVEGRDGQTGGSDPQAAADRMMARGELARGRRVWSRLGQIAAPEREVLLWLADRGGSRPAPATAALLYARERGPIEVRQALDRAAAARELAAAAYAKEGPKRGRLLTKDGAAAMDRLSQAMRVEDAASAALVAWGTWRLGAALSAWWATGERRVA